LSFDRGFSISVVKVVRENIAVGQVLTKIFNPALRYSRAVKRQRLQTIEVIQDVQPGIRDSGTVKIQILQACQGFNVYEPGVGSCSLTDRQGFEFRQSLETCKPIVGYLRFA
jgi:hypothetical protein